MFDRYYWFAQALLKIRANLACAPTLPQVLAPVQYSRLEQQRRVTESTAYILRARQLAVGIAKAYVAETAMRRRRWH